MATLRETASSYADEIRERIAWVVVWKTGRGWNASAFWLSCDTDVFEDDDLPEVHKILEQDPNAVMINGYYCGHLGEDMNVNDLAAGIRWHYENGYNRLSDSTALPEEDNAQAIKVIYTFGSDERFPFRGGWVEIVAPSMRDAHAIFRKHYPDRTPGILNCSDYYTEQQFNESDMPITGNRGAFCHCKLSA